MDAKEHKVIVEWEAAGQERPYGDSRWIAVVSVEGRRLQPCQAIELARIFVRPFRDYPDSPFEVKLRSCEALGPADLVGQVEKWRVHLTQIYDD